MSRESFYTTTLCAFFSVLFLGLITLAWDQLNNLARNMTTNEKINSSRYSYLQDEEGNFSNRFDRGVWSNIMEFLQLPSYHVEYSRVFTLPELTPAAANTKEEKLHWLSKMFGKSSHQPVPQGDDLGGLSDIYASNNNQALQQTFQSGEGVAAGTMEMRRRKSEGMTEGADRVYMV